MAVDIFPRELTRDIPYITMIGDSELHIEHHHGMIRYQTEEVSFDTGCGIITITGCDLIVTRYTTSEAGLQGQIDAVIIKENGR